jgi:23S rRNA pseudouridine1911/1915/1917 synthase
LNEPDHFPPTSEGNVPSEVAFSQSDSDGAEDLFDGESVLDLAVAESGRRLDTWLASRLPERSRSEIQRWIGEGRITVGGKLERASHKLAAGDTVVVRVPAAEPYDVEAEPIPLEIIYEDGDLLVIDKPAGMVVHPAAGHWHGTLVNAVLHHCPDLEGVGGVHRPGIVHRLDKDTSGLILVAKNDRAHRDLQSQFKGREVEKSYLALTYGRVSPSRGEITAAVGRDVHQRKRMAIVPDGRAAVTRYQALSYYGKHTLLACHPLTGRTHQIRVHLAHIGHPIVGDSVYGGRRRPPVPCLRQFLHAHRIRFRLPRTGEQIEFTSPLPADLQAVLDALGETENVKRET